MYAFRRNLIAVCGLSIIGVLGSFSDSVRAEEPDLTIFPMRSNIEIDRDIASAIEARELAVARMEEAKGRYQEVSPHVQSTKDDIKALDRQKNLAKKASNETELISIESEKKANKQVQNLLNRLKDLRKAEFEAAQAEANLANLAVQTLQMEQELVSKRMELRSLSLNEAGALEVSATAQVVKDLEIRMLKLEKEQAEATQKVASREKSVVERRMKLYEERAKLPRMNL